MIDVIYNILIFILAALGLFIFYVFYKFYIHIYVEAWKYKRMDPSLKTFLKPIKGLIQIQRQCREKYNDSHHFIKQMMKENPDQLAYLTNLGDKAFLVITDTQLVKEMSLDAKNYRKLKVIKHLDCSYSKGIFFVNQNVWKYQRALAGHAFNYEHLKNMIPIMKSTTRNFMLSKSQNIEKNNILEVLDATQTLIGEFYVTTFLSADIKQKSVQGQNLSLALSDYSSLTFQRSRSGINLFLLLLLGEKTLNTNFSKMDENLEFKIQEIRKVLLQIIEERIAGKTKNQFDFLHIYLTEMNKRQKEYDLLKAQGKDVSNFLLITKQEIVQQLITFYFAAIDTTGHLLSFALFCAAEYPQYYEKLQKQINQIIKTQDDITFDNLQKLEYTEKYLYECLRMWPPAVGILSRQVNEDTQLGPYFLKKDTIVGTNIIGIMHNPKFYKNPDVFDPERWFDKQNLSNDPYSFIPFSAGPKSCIGKHLSIMESKIILTYFLKFFHFQRTEVPLVVYCKFLYEPLNDKLLKISPKLQNNWK